MRRTHIKPLFLSASAPQHLYSLWSHFLCTLTNISWFLLCRLGTEIKELIYREPGFSSLLPLHIDIFNQPTDTRIHARHSENMLFIYLFIMWSDHKWSGKINSLHLHSSCDHLCLDFREMLSYFVTTNLLFRAKSIWLENLPE